MTETTTTKTALDVARPCFALLRADSQGHPLHSDHADCEIGVWICDGWRLVELQSRRLLVRVEDVDWRASGKWNDRVVGNHWAPPGWAQDVDVYVLVEGEPAPTAAVVGDWLAEASLLNHVEQELSGDLSGGRDESLTTTEVLREHRIDP